MNTIELRSIAQAMVAPGKGILAADESTSTIKKRFDAIKVESSEENRRFYRELLFTAKGCEKHISGVILYDETIRQSAGDGTTFPKLLASKGIVPGIKVDAGAKDLPGFPGEKITEGLDGLRERLIEYHELGARFAKWRAVIDIDTGKGVPTDYALAANAAALARYAALCQEQGIVPIVEPEVLMDGAHTLETCYQVTSRTLQLVFDELYRARVDLPGMILKPNMVIAGKKCAKQASAAEIAVETVRCFRHHVPAAVPGIVFLSGGQSEAEATANLSAMNALGKHPWELSFSYGRALQQSVLDAWRGKKENKEAAQRAYLHRCKLNGAARSGAYKPAMEKELVTA
jgi:fructose-bisphosphate aldolase, class I